MSQFGLPGLDDVADVAQEGAAQVADLLAGSVESVAGAADPVGIGRASLGLWQAMLSNPEALIEAQLEVATGWTSIVGNALGNVSGETPKPPVVEPAKGDNRWKHPAWRENAMFDALKQGYLLASKAMLDSIDAAEGVDPATRSRVRFFAKQFADAMSPTNFAFANPAVIEETFRTGGKNLERGVKNLVADVAQNSGRPSLVDKRAFEVGKNIATSAGSVVFRNDLIELIEYAPLTETVYARPLLIVPPWINKYYILDLQPANSLIKYATENGMQVFVVSWKNPDASYAHVGFEDYLRLGPMAAGDAVREIAGSADLNQIGYCLGGTLTAMELAYLAKTDPKKVNAVTFFAALTDFEHAGDIKNFVSPESIGRLEEKMRRDGVFDARAMSDAFSMLRANDLIWNVAVERYLLGKSAPPFDLLFWNDDATRMPAAMHSYYLRHMYVENALAKGELEIAGVPIELGAIRNDVFSIATVDDHIAPWRSVYAMTQTFGGSVRFTLGHSGHIAGIVNPPGSNKGNYWRSAVNPPTPDAWLAGAEKIEGSWWPEWLAWLGDRSGSKVPARPAPGSEKYPALTPAPGTYVFE